MLYDPTAGDNNKPPVLNAADPRAREVFRLKYLAYVAKHKRLMRTRPAMYRTMPKAVMECVEADLLMYMCKCLLPTRYRTRDPANVSATAVHKWVMSETKQLSNKGIRKGSPRYRT